MFIGHFGVALAAKRVAPRTSLGTLVMAAQFVDLIWPIFLLLGMERVIIAPGTTAVTPLDFINYPLSHSLLADLGWASLFAGIYKLVKRDTRGAICLWFVVMSHWVLDALTHQPDLPLLPRQFDVRRPGFVELRVLDGDHRGHDFHCRRQDLRASHASRRAHGGIRVSIIPHRAGADLHFQYFSGSPPPSEKAVAWASFSLWLFVPWAYWLDHRRLPGPPPRPGVLTTLGDLSEQPPSL